MLRLGLLNNEKSLRVLKNVENYFQMPGRWRNNLQKSVKHIASYGLFGPKPISTLFLTVRRPL